MRFGAVSPAEAEGAILAHSVRGEGLVLRKGVRLSAEDCAALSAAGVARVVVARLEAGDEHEDAAAARIAAAMAAPGVRVSAPTTGRANLHAEAPGVLRVDRAAVARLNGIDESVTLATLPDHARVAARQMLGTVKVIPYAAPRAAVDGAVAAAAGALRLHPFRALRAALIVTRTPGQKPALAEKGAAAIIERLRAFGDAAPEPGFVAHETAAVAASLRAAQADIALVLGGSATSDRADVIPAAIVQAGGVVERFGMPVDPGNLLVLGAIGAMPVVGLPGCARSPKLNGADWVLERLFAGLPVTGEDIAAMGVGGLLKEIPARPAPRQGQGTGGGRAMVSALLLAAGGSSRMGGPDKLLTEAGGRPLIRRCAEAMVASGIDEVIVVLGANAEARGAALTGLDVRLTINPGWRSGMAGSIRAGLAAMAPGADAALVALADMPEIGAAHVDALLAAFDPDEGREIVRSVAASGRPGNPTLFGRRFFEALSMLTGDKGARDLIAEHEGFVAEVRAADDAPLIDLDTPEAWAAWRAGQTA